MKSVVLDKEWLQLYLASHCLMLALAFLQPSDPTGSPPESSKYTFLAGVLFLWDYMYHVTRVLEQTSVPYQIWAWTKPQETFIFLKSKMKETHISKAEEFLAIPGQNLPCNLNFSSEYWPG